MAGDDLKSWVSDKLMAVLGYSQPAVVEYLIAIAKSSKSPSDLVPELVNYGFSSSDATAFAECVCARVPHKTAAVNIYQQEEAEAVMRVKKQKTYMLLDADVDEVSMEKKSSESRKPDRGNKKFRKKSSNH